MQVEFKKEISEENHTKIYVRIGNFTKWHLLFVSLDNPLPDTDYWMIQDLFMRSSEISHKYTFIKEFNLKNDKDA